jgi:ATP-binding cassette subfamily B protein
MRSPTMGEISYFIYKVIKPYYWSLGVMLFVAIFWAIDLSLRPYLLKVILDLLARFPYQGVLSYALFPLLGYFFLTFANTTIFRCYDYFVEIKMIPNLRKSIVSTIFDYLLKHNHFYYQDSFSGNLVNKINDLSNSIPEIIQISIDRFFSHILGLFIAIYTLWYVHSEFAIIVFIWSLLFIAISFSCSKKIQILSDNWSEFGSIITGKIVDVLSNILSVRLFSRQDKEKKSLDHSLQDAVQAEQKLQWFYLWMWLFYGYSFVFTQGICLYFLIKGREQGLISIGDFALVLGLNTSIVDFLKALTKDFSQFSKLVGKVSQALRITTTPLETQDRPEATDLIVTQGQIVFDSVNFSYNSTDPIFENVSVIIPPGQKVGLVGYSGSGKSTFINLILRLFDVTGGSIYIDNQNIKDITQNSLRKSISIIPQDLSLFHRTLLENIQYGKLEASTEEIINATQRAHAHEFISKLPLGYESLVGERGVKLSGGQRQRIAICRAILKNAPILILDEATSQLDSLTEKYIQESLFDLMQNKTTIVIAHRLSTLLRMDRILVFDQGKIVQDGPHAKLLHSGLYKTLWSAQIDGFLPQKRK